jgi:hypothetical protein
MLAASTCWRPVFLAGMHTYWPPLSTEMCCWLRTCLCPVLLAGMGTCSHLDCSHFDCSHLDSRFHPVHMLAASTCWRPVFLAGMHTYWPPLSTEMCCWLHTCWCPVLLAGTDTARCLAACAHYCLLVPYSHFGCLGCFENMGTCFRSGPYFHLDSCFPLVQLQRPSGTRSSFGMCTGLSSGTRPQK